MRNYRTIENYGIGLLELGFQNNIHSFLLHSQVVQILASLTASNRQHNPITTPSDRPIYDEATLIVYNSKNIPKVEVSFKDIFPTSLSGLAYAQDATDVEYFVQMLLLDSCTMSLKMST